jgi:putative peptidoglycan lipid II flippase
VSYLYYADRLNQLPLGLIGTAVGTALLPKLAQKIAANDHSKSVHLFNRALEWTLILTLPAATALGLIAGPIISTLFERGEFDMTASMATSHALAAYALGLPAFVGIKVLSTALYAQENTKTPVKITLVCAGLNIVLCLILIHPLAHVGIALATSIAGWVQAGILCYQIEKKNTLEFDAQIKRSTLRVLAACIAMGVVLWLMSSLLKSWVDAGSIKRMIALAAMVAAGGLLYLGGLIGLGVIHPRTLVQSLKAQDI